MILFVIAMFSMSFTFILTGMLAVVTNPYVAFEGTYKPHCKQIKMSCEAKTILYKSYHNKPLCEGEVIEVDKPVQRGVYSEKFYLNAGTRIETPHKVFELYEFKKWQKYKVSKEVDTIDREGYYVIVSEVPYMKYTIRKTTYCKEKVEYICGDKVSPWIPISDYHFIESDGKDYLIC